MSVITKGNMPSNLLPIASKAFDGAIGQVPAEHLMLFDKGSSSGRSFEEMFAYSGLGTTRHKPEGSSTEMDTVDELWVARITYNPYSLAMVITKEAMDDGQVIDITAKRAAMLRRAVEQNRNITAGLFYDAMFTTELAGDGKAICATDHVIAQGTARNELTVAASLSEVSYEQAKIDIKNMVDNRGLKAFIRPVALIVPDALEHKAKRLLQAEKQSGTANNDPNLHKGDTVRVASYLTSNTQWFIKTSAPDSLLFFERVAPFLYEDLHFSTLNKRFAVYHREAFGVGDWRGVFGSAAA